MSGDLEYLARKADADPFFLGCVLARYASSEGLSEEQLSKRLGCDQTAWAAVRLCRAPAGGAQEFQKGIEQISAKFGIKSPVLAEVVRHGQAIIALAGSDVRSTTLAAARDREQRVKTDGKKE